MKYLGVPIDNKKLCKSLWDPILEKIESKLSSWQGRFLSLGGRLVLINSSLTNVPLYMLSLYKCPKGVLKKWIYLGKGYYGKVATIRRNTIWLSGI
jgi:hypothetical protein